VATASYWSVERDGGTVVATCPEALRYPSDNRPEWMGHCATALRDELRLVEIEAGTLLEATLIGAPPPGAGMENVLLQYVGVPDAHVHAGVRLCQLPQSGDSAVQRYERVPVAAVESEESGALLAAVRVPVIDGLEVETARHVWLAARTVIAADLPAGVASDRGGVDLRIRFTVESPRRRGNIELVKKLLDGVCAAFQLYGGANLDEVARRLVLELGGDPERMRELASSPRGALLGAYDCFWLRGEGVQVSPADDRIHAAEVAFVTGAVPQIEIELREIAAA
jgi:hypothetical protein